MRLREAIRLWCSIGDDAIRILHKRIGKTRGLDAIEKQIRDEATSSAKKSFGGDLDRVAKIHIDRYVDQHMKYMKKAFRKLNSPKTDVSKKRGKFIGDTEDNSAKQWGQTKGYERLAKTKKKNIYKSWITNGDNPCDDCQANEDQGPIPVGDTFQSGHYAPPAHTNTCQCELEFSDDDGNELDIDYEGDES